MLWGAPAVGPEAYVELDQHGFRDVSLIEGERIDSILNLNEDGSGDSDGHPEVMLLTDRRVIHLHGNGNRRKALFASIQDMDAVEIAREQQGQGAFIWAGLALMVAILLYIVIGHDVIRIASAIIVALMGVYLIVDQFMSPGKPMLIFKTGSSELRFDLKGDSVSSEVYTFINRLFQLRDESGSGPSSRGRRFSPR